MRRVRKLFIASVAVLAAGLATSPAPTESAAVHPQAWGPAVNLSPGAPSWNLLPTSAAIDVHGDVLAVWVHTDDSGAALMAAFRAAGHKWRSPVSVPGSRGAQDAEVAFDGDGDAVLVWRTSHAVAAVRRTAAGSWTKTVTLYRSRAAMESRAPNSMDLAVNTNGRAAAVWSSNAGLKAAIGVANGTWSQASTVPPKPKRSTTRVVLPAGPTSSSGDVNVVMDDWGRATVVAYTGSYLGKIVTTSRAPGGTWSAPEALTKVGFVTHPQIAVKADGTIAVAWRGSPNGWSTAIRVARKSRTGDWVRTEPLPIGKNLSKLRMVMDGAGTVTVVWLPENGALRRAENHADGTWTPKVRVTPPDTAGDEYALVANEAGDVLLSSTAPPGAHPVWALRRSPSGLWDTHRTTLSTRKGATRGPAVAIGPGGGAVVVWTFQPAGSTTSRVQASRFSP